MRLADALLMAGDDAGFGVGDIYVGGYAAGYANPSGGNISVPLNSLTGGFASAPSPGDLVVVSQVVALRSGTPVTTNPSGWTTRDRSYLVDGTKKKVELRTIYRTMPASVPTSVSLIGATLAGNAVAVMVLRHVDEAEFAIDTSTYDATEIFNNFSVVPAIDTMANTGNAIALVPGGGAHANGVRTFGDAGSDYDKFITAGSSHSGNDATIGMGFAVVNGEPFTPTSQWSFSGTDSATYRSITHPDLMATE